VSTQRFTSMGCEVVIGGADTETREAVEALFAARDQLFSRFRIDSELNSVNGRAGRPLHVSEEFASMLGMALAVARESDGLVVPTVGAALEAADTPRTSSGSGTMDALRERSPSVTGEPCSWSGGCSPSPTACSST
jgi:thiamine biosynthesis lipoprotein ApbE